MTFMAELDHFALSASTLEEGVAAVEAALGVPLAGGGRHEKMGTHNRLLGLGPVYLEVIAIDPDGIDPGRPRPFDLDNFSGAPRLTNWIARTDDLDAALAAAPAAAGPATEMSRGSLVWHMGVPVDGKLPFSGAFPAIIQWPEGVHPSQTLPDAGCRLKRLEISHPDADALRDALSKVFTTMPVVLHQGPLAMRAEIETPGGLRVLE
ncbi:VOC family protein [Psychromarinibacter halotolerans]|uniref:VOC family protein n=1 Tax=Psychromarinibacter halotolerans TaxID=1775175 RepID=A0ABV7GMU5_9RHOB